MKRDLISVSENANIELNENSIELLLQGVCKSYECSDFRANQCKMKHFLTALESGDWEWSQTWMTPTKFFLHFLKNGPNATEEVAETFRELEKKWQCINDPTVCDCAFMDEMNSLRKYILSKHTK